LLEPIGSPGKQPDNAFYRCLRCNGDLELQKDDSLACSVCRAAYPSIEGIRVFSSNPTRFLQAHVNRVREKRRELSVSKEKLASFVDIQSRDALSLAARGYDGQLANLEIIERTLAPVKEYLAARPGQRGLFDDFDLSGIGWPAFGMLSYFYRDWAPTEEGKFMSDLFVNAVERYCGDHRESAAVIGCGPCRLVYDVAELFPMVFGVDLSIDTLLLAKDLLDGAEMEFCFSFPRTQIPIHEKAVKLKGPAQRPDEIELVAANATKLPFASSSLSCVITPYLLEVLQNPDAAVSEIRRVLAPGGIWISFSSLRLLSNPPRADQLDDLDLQSFLRRSGFALLHQAMYRYTLTDMSPLSEWAPTLTDAPVFFVAEKNSSQDSERSDHLADYFAGKGELIWTTIPRIATSISLIQERVFSGSGVEERRRIAKAAASGITGENSRYVTNEGAMMAEGLLRSFDGTRTTQEILGLLRQKFGELLTANEFLKFLGDLYDSKTIDLDIGRTQ
jgi:SAM-dependent methyltransferase